MPLAHNTNQLTLDEMKTYASMASLIRERVLTRAYTLEISGRVGELSINSRAEKIAMKIRRS